MKKIILTILLLLFSSTSFAQENSYPTGFFRADVDSVGLQLWAGAKHNTIYGFPINSLVYMDSNSVGEFDIGTEFALNDLLITNPMVGIVFDFQQRKAVSIIFPELFIYFDNEYLYGESWMQVFWDTNLSLEPEDSNIFYTRDFLLYKIDSWFLLGPQVESTISLNRGFTRKRDRVLSFQGGARSNIVYGESELLGLFLGYEFINSAREYYIEETDSVEDRGLVGRVTYIHFW